MKNLSVVRALRGGAFQVQFATLYIIGCSAKNRMRARLRRMREPRYLIGAVTGIAYVVFTLVIRSRAYEVRNGGSTGGDAAFALMGPTVGGTALALAALASWAMPFPSALLDFSRAEIAFLFPAPMTRAWLVLHRVFRSQAVVFAAALIMALAYPIGSIAGRARGLASAWVLLMAIRLFFAVVVLARSGARRSDAGVRSFGWPALLLPLAAVISVGAPVLAALQHPSDVPVFGMAGYLADVVHQAAGTPVAHFFLLPFMALVRPLFARNFTEFGSAIVGALGIATILTAWLVWADRLSAATADAAAERQATMPARQARSYVARRIGWQLQPIGPPEVAFFWKALLQTFRTVDRRVIFRIVLILAWLVAASMFVTRARGLLFLLGVASTWGALFALFMLPQVLRMDLRQDLEHLELLRTWPVRGASVLRGEILWPALVVTVIAWLLGSMAMGLSLGSTSRIPSVNRIAGWTSLLILCPAIVIAQYTVHNAVAVVFPGWVPIGPNRPRGVDAAGQRLILLLANWIGLAIALIPGIAVMVILSMTLRRVLGPVVLPIGALVTTMAVFGEVWVATEMLGRMYERLDVTSVERPD